MYRPGVLNLEWFWPCPKCGHYQIYDLKQIKELPNEQKEFDHNPQLIRNDGAARYECVNCGNDVPESARAAMNDKGVWKTIDEVLSATGELVTKRKQAQTVSYRWNRLIDFSFKWSECLARFFEASRSGNPILLKDFLNEDMAEFWSIKAEERPTSWLIAKCARYTMKDEALPSGVLAIFVGIDTQDKGYYFVMRGYGSGKESWLLDCDYIPCEMGAEQNFEAVFQTVKKRIERRELFTADGRRLFINFGLIDRGGHKANYVDYIAGHLDGVFAYIGAKDRLHPLVKAGKDDIYFGNTENLARIVAADAELSNWHLPEDIPTDYLNQFVKQYEKEEVDRYGNTVKKWMKGGADHFRDCYDCETEVLTRIGFKKFKDLNESDLLATVNLETDTIQYRRPISLIENNYSGKMIKLGGGKHQSLDLVVTPKHRMVVYHGEGGKVEGKVLVKKANELNIRDKIKTRTTWEGIYKKKLYFPKCKQNPCIYIDSLLLSDFMGWYVAEGYRQKQKYSHRVMIYQTNKKGRDLIRTLCKKLPWRFCETKRGFIFTNKQIYDFVGDAGDGKYNKKVPQWIKDSDKKIIDKFIESAVNGDGWHDRNQEIYSTVSKQLSDDMAELYLKSGYAVTIREREPKPYFIRGRFGDNTVKQYYISRRHSKANQLRNSRGIANYKEIDYSGKVYCATVENGTLIVKRNGKVCICGNCENYIQAALIISGVDEVLYNGEEVDAVRREQEQETRQQSENKERVKRGEVLDEPKPIVNEFLAGIQSRWARGRGF
jgi:transcription elongation factor Elf1